MKLSNQAQANTKMADHLASTIVFRLAEILGKLGKFASSIGILKNLGCCTPVAIHFEHTKGVMHNYRV